jgi:hypothetical protein
MDCKLFLEERDDFCGRMYGLRLGKIDVLKEAMEKSVEKKGLVKLFLIVPVGQTHRILKKAFREKIGVDYLFSQELDDLAKAGHDRWPIQSYFIRHGGHQEATGGDEKLRLLSAKKIWQRKIATMTSLEISQFSFEYVLASGVFTDVKSVSLAAGSRDVDGFVPSVHRRSAIVRVDCYHPSIALDNLRSRVAA